MKKILSIVMGIVMGIVILAGIVIGLRLHSNLNSRVEKEEVITSTDLEEAVLISELSSAEFVYNAVAEKTDEDGAGDVICYIAYNATVKVGIDMEDVLFEVDDESRTVKATLPDITVTSVSVDTDSLSYIPKDPDLSLKEIIRLCKEDAVNGAQESETLYALAEENLQSVIEALLTPLIEEKDYTLLFEKKDDTLIGDASTE